MVYLFIILSCQLFLLVNRFVYGQFIPGLRLGHTANTVGNKIYFIGGYNFAKSIPTSEIFYLNKETDTWEEIKSQGIKLPFKVEHTANIGGINQDIIFIMGGLIGDTNLLYQFDTKTNIVSIPIIQGKVPTSRAFMSSVNFEGKIYVFSGQNSDDIYFNSFDILDTINLRWEIGSLINAPTPRSKHTSTLVNNVIYYIGGMQLNGNYISMNDIYQYDIGKSTWSLKKSTLALGDVPGPRGGHSAVLVEDKICIYGGIYSPKETIAMLDTTTLVWTIPQFNNPKAPKLPNLVYHTATMKDNYNMFIAFGNDTDVRVLNNNFYMFDFKNFQWNIFTVKEVAKTKDPDTPMAPSPTSPMVESHKPFIISLSVGLAIIGLAAIVIISVIVYRRTKRNRNFENRNLPETVTDNPYPTNFSQNMIGYQHTPTTTRQYNSSQLREQSNHEIIPQYAQQLRESPYHEFIPQYAQQSTQFREQPFIPQYTQQPQIISPPQERNLGSERPPYY
ncbi:galactose oxidase [Rhizophagus irregularis]|uniref:Galactose oxidase n=1 Tax=Rhizophagus irregularis TaxID=588596 RepID=A0A2I1H830_9GLOM|nr:galactose oxidase [Rhizophagus irregularis]